MNLPKSLLIILLFITPTLQTLAQETKHQHRHGDHLKTLVNRYLEAKDALAEDDLEAAKSSLAEFRKEVTHNKEMTHHTEHSSMHAKHHAAMTRAVNEAGEATDIEALRNAFMKITDNLKMALENQGYESEELYLQYCPMADGGEGAHWISDQKEIANPYLGQKMPTCGETEKTYGTAGSR